MNIQNSEIDLTINILKKRRNWEEIFSNKNPIVLDVGCGKGHFLAETAFQNPDKNFLAIEVYKKGLRNTRKKIQNRELTNVRIIPFEAHFILSNCFYPDEISEIYINFPDPWPKKRHWKRRLINSQFIKTLYPLLEEKGRINIATDFEAYIPVILKCFEDHPGFINLYKKSVSASLEDKGYVNQLDDRIQSLYERKFREKEKTIYYFSFEKKRVEDKIDD